MDAGSRLSRRLSWAAAILLALIPTEHHVRSAHGDQAAAAPIAAPAASVTFVAYNIENYLLMPRRVDGEVVADAPKPEPAIRHLIATIAALQPDLLGVCEIGADQVTDLQQRLAAAGIQLPHAEVSSGADTTRQLALLSRFPIVATDSQRELTYELDGHILPMQRGILDVTVQLSDDFQLRCLGVHFKSKREIPEFDQALMRRHEAGLLRRHIDSVFAADANVRLLVYGDLNDTRNEPVIRAVQGTHNTPHYLRLVHVADDRGQRWTHYWATADLYSRIDYLMVSRRLWPHVLTEHSFIPADAEFQRASDHRPLVLRLDPAP